MFVSTLPFVLIALLIAAVVAIMAWMVWKGLSVEKFHKSQLTLSFDADNGSGSLRLRVTDRKWVEILITQYNFNPELNVSVAATFPIKQRREVYEGLASCENFYIPGCSITDGQSQINDLQGVETGDEMTFYIGSRNHHEGNAMVRFSKDEVHGMAHWLESLA